MRYAKSGIFSAWYVSAAVALLMPSLGAAKGPIERIEVVEGATPVVSIDGPAAREFTIWSGPGTLTGLGAKAVMSTSSGDLARMGRRRRHAAGRVAGLQYLLSL